MEIYSTVWTYLWDLVDEGLESAVGYCREELGLDAISVATAYHAFQQLRPSRPGPKLLSADAALYFQPDWRLYQDTCLRPRVAELAQRGNPLAQLSRACQDAGLDLIAWTVCLHNSYLAAAYPHCVQQTAYGDSLGWALCAGVDDVRAYVIALGRDLASNYGIRRLELESCHFGGYGHVHYHLKEGVALGNIGRYLFSLSFSSGCMDKARARGIDAEGLRVWVCETLDPVFATGQPLEGELEGFLDAHPELAAYQQLREELVASLVAEIKAATGVEVSFILMGDRWTGGVQRESIAAKADLLELLAYTPSPEEVKRQVQEVASEIAVARLVLGLQAYPPGARSAEELLANVDCGLRLGIRQFSYYNYGIAPRPCLEWIGRCVRYCKNSRSI